MQGTARNLNYSLALVIVGAILSAPALADKPAHAGGNQTHKSVQKSQGASAGHGGNGQGQSVDRDARNRGMRDDDREYHNGGQRDASDDRWNAAREVGTLHPGMHFDEHRQDSVRRYYAEQMRTGRCPPGLAKKHNGCLPPGQAKKWAMGHRLPRDVIYHDPPSTILDLLGAPPSGYRYVRVDNDILLLSSVGLVVDAIQSLGE